MQPNGQQIIHLYALTSSGCAQYCSRIPYHALMQIHPIYGSVSCKWSIFIVGHTNYLKTNIARTEIAEVVGLARGFSPAHVLIAKLMTGIEVEANSTNMTDAYSGRSTIRRCSARSFGGALSMQSYSLYR